MGDPVSVAVQVAMATAGPLSSFGPSRLFPLGVPTVIPTFLGEVLLLGCGQLSLWDRNADWSEVLAANDWSPFCVPQE